MSKLGGRESGELSALADPTNVDLRIVDDVPDADNNDDVPTSPAPARGMTQAEIRAHLSRPIAANQEKA